jgi:hypothetical protein
MPSGNCLVDRHEAADRRTHDCPDCSGLGRVPYEDLTMFSDKLADVMWRRKKAGKEVTTFRDMLKLAREIRHLGQICNRCDGCGSEVV